MKEFINAICNEYGIEMADLLIALFSAIVTALTVVFSSIITIIINKKNIKESQEQFEQSITLQMEQFDESIQFQKDIFIQNVVNDNEKNRISIMPYFELKSEVSINRVNNEIEIPLAFTNVGNGVAVDIQLVNEDLEVYKDEELDVSYKQCNPMNRNVIKIGENVETGIKCKYSDNSCKVVFCLQYEDMMQRKYIQEFEFFYCIKIDKKIYIQHYFKPVCVKDYEYLDAIGKY